jgi:hypothetical protein
MKTVAEMTVEEKSQARQWIGAWQRAGPEMERMRREEIRQADTAGSIPAFDGLFEGAVRDFPASPTSGLVEQQRCFHRAKK